MSHAKDDQNKTVALRLLGLFTDNGTDKVPKGLQLAGQHGRGAASQNLIGNGSGKTIIMSLIMK